jgi:hypothetical protein
MIRYIYIYIGLHVKYLLFLSDFNELEFSRKFFEKYSRKQIFIKIRPVGAELFHADGQTTDMANLIVIDRDIVRYVYWLQCKVPIVLLRF